MIFKRQLLDIFSEKIPKTHTHTQIILFYLTLFLENKLTKWESNAWKYMRPSFIERKYSQKNVLWSLGFIKLRIKIITFIIHFINILFNFFHLFFHLFLVILIFYAIFRFINILYVLISQNYLVYLIFLLIILRLFYVVHFLIQFCLRALFLIDTEKFKKLFNFAEFTSIFSKKKLCFFVPSAREEHCPYRSARRSTSLWYRDIILGHLQFDQFLRPSESILTVYHFSLRVASHHWFFVKIKIVLC